MRRLARHLFTLCSAVSVVLFVATAWMWARSHVTSDAVRFGTHVVQEGRAVIRQWRVESAGGGVRVEWARYRWPDRDDGPPEPRFRFWEGGRRPPRYPRAGTGLLVFGFAWQQMNLTSPPLERLYREVVLPYWALAASLAIAPAAWWLRRRAGRRHDRVAAGLCPECGYDLRASPDRCPECGTPAAGRVNG
jgi:hypothetical protein